METLQLIKITVAIVIAVAGSFSLILGFFALFMNYLLNAKIDPMKQDIDKLKEGQAKLEAGQAKLEKGQNSLSITFGNVLDKGLDKILEPIIKQQKEITDLFKRVGLLEIENKKLERDKTQNS